ncbi:MAG: phosphotransferase [Chloroflexota bacterium]|nr:phosphotransferase [Chloroflexota bacterium]
MSKTVVAIEMQELEEDTAKIAKHLRTFCPEFIDAGPDLLAERAHTYLAHALPKLLQTELPLTNCSWDYKADNLIYRSEAAPVLVDPDNAGRIPRLYDLAIAALLFHHVDAPLAPRRVLTRSEWLVFLEGYSRHVQLTEQEESAWDEVLLCACMDEAIWLLANQEEAWANPEQSELMLSLLLADLSTFALS